MGAPAGAGHVAPKAFSPSLPQESSCGKSRSNGNKRPKKSPWAMTWRRSCPAGSRWSTASPTTTPSWMITSGQTEGPPARAGLARSAPAPSQVCTGALPNPRCRRARAAPLCQELCFYTMSQTLQAAAALVGHTSEAVRHLHISRRQKCSEGRVVGLLQIYTWSKSRGWP